MVSCVVCLAAYKPKIKGTEDFSVLFNGVQYRQDSRPVFLPCIPKFNESEAVRLQNDLVDVAVMAHFHASTSGPGLSSKGIR